MKAKKMSKILLMMTGAAMLLGSCQKEDRMEESTDLVEDAVVSDQAETETSREGLYFATGCEYDYSDIVGDCAVVTESSQDYPKTITIDFGDGCEGHNGKVRTGQIVIVITDDMHNTGSTRSMEFVNFSIGESTIEGNRFAENIGLSESGNILISETGTMTVNRGGCDRTKTYDHLREWIEGSGTCDRDDDEFLITGSGTVSGKHGKNGSHTILTPLHLAPGSCQYILSGTVEVKKGKRGGVIDFGEGNCDNSATLTTFKGKEIEIDLDKRRLIK